MLSESFIFGADIAESVPPKSRVHWELCEELVKVIKLFHDDTLLIRVSHRKSQHLDEIGILDCDQSPIPDPVLRLERHPITVRDLHVSENYDKLVVSAEVGKGTALDFVDSLTRVVVYGVWDLRLGRILHHLGLHNGTVQREDVLIEVL